MTFSNKNVLITGGAGFIGANFTYKFLDLGCNVHLIEKKGSNLWRLKDIIEAYLLAIKNIQVIKEEIFNLGTGKQSTIGEVVRMV